MSKIKAIKKYEWLSQKVRQGILDRKFPVGHKMLTDNELMAKYQVSRSTVNHAMNILQENGYIQRQVGRGTFVSDKMQSIGEIAIISEDRFFSSETSPSWRMVISSVFDKTRQRNELWQPKLHIIPDDNSKEVMLSALTQSNILGVVTMTPLKKEIIEKLEERDIPLIYIAPEKTQSHHYKVFFDMDEFHLLPFMHLAETGCKSVAVFGNASENGNPLREFDHFNKGISESGLECRPEWMISYSPSHFTEQAGWEMFRKLWNLPTKPDALFVDDDLNFRGVTRAALELGVQFPEDIKVITMNPIGAPIGYNKEVTYIGLDIDLLANAVVDLLEKITRNKTIENPKVKVPVKIIKGKTT